jgi:N-acetylglutamate synthase-like GNAT family acetyltransferase
MNNWKMIVSSENEAKFIKRKLTEFNRTKVPSPKKETSLKLNLHIKDEQEQIIAGINALIYHWRVLYIRHLFVASQHRDKKLGGILLNEVESRAKAMKVELVHLDTFDWQAKDFYLKRGYEIFGVLENCPKNHKRFYMKKKL